MLRYFSIVCSTYHEPHTNKQRGHHAESSVACHTPRLLNIGPTEAFEVAPFLDILLS